MLRQPLGSLRAVKIVHTIVWAFFVAAIVAIPIFGLAGNFRFAAWSAAIVFAEVAVLAVNRWRCPLTGVAARFTDDRADNFDIYLPVWLARHNKVIFGGLYVLGMVVTFAWWRGWLPR